MGKGVQGKRNKAGLILSLSVRNITLIASEPTQGEAMSRPKILIFAPREEPPDSIKALEGLGCEVVIGDRDWQSPRTHYEDIIVDAARDTVALMGTSIR